MVITPDIPNLPFVEQKGVKYFELVAEPVQREILPGLFIKGWGYNGSLPGPTIQVYPGDYVNIRVFNRLPEPTSVHWHGLDVPNVMDGVPDVEPSPKIEPNCYFDYHFKIVNPPGTHIYHTHFNVPRQELMGLSGGLIILNPAHENIKRDYFIMLGEFALPDLPKGIVKPGLYQFQVTAVDGNPIYPGNRLTRSTILVASGETWDVEFTAHNPGIWPFHCHIPHHMSNNFTDPSGGMFTTINYR